MTGWIKIHRSIEESPIVNIDSDYFRVWVHLLLNATHTDRKTYFNGKTIILKPGQLVTGRKKIAQKTGVQESKVKRILKVFKTAQQIDQLVTNRGSLISILQWDKYQIDDQQNDQQMTNKWTTDDQQMTTKQECKELKNYKNDIYKQQLQQQSTYSGGSQGVLSDYLSEDDYDVILAKYDKGLTLIDTVDELVRDPRNIGNPRGYIMGYAKNTDWPLKNTGVEL